MRRKFVINLSVNTLQLIVNQLFGLVIFYILSTGLDKNNFGQINLALALLLAAFNILSFGIDQVIVKKIAGGDDPQFMLSLYLGHVLLTGTVFYGLILMGRGLFPTAINAYDVILLIGIGKLMIFFSTPFKQSAIGLERFKLLGYLSVISNIARACGLAVLALLHHITLHSVIIVFIGGDVLELVAGGCLFRRATGLSPAIRWNKGAYYSLLKESLPQLGVVVITSALSRFDWIFIGIVVSAASLADYSFAYKVFELSTFPLLAIAPLLIPLFTRLFKSTDSPKIDLKLLVRIEMVIAAFTIVLLNSCWSPVIDSITAGKYGAVNAHTIFLLSLCIPLLYITNFFWTINFAKGRLKLILTAFIITFSVNVTGDIILIPLYKNEGAAIAYLIGYLAQTIFFIVKNDVEDLRKISYPLLLCTVCACLSVFGAKTLFTPTWAEVVAAVLFYLFALVITMQVKAGDWKAFKGLLN